MAIFISPTSFPPLFFPHTVLSHFLSPPFSSSFFFLFLSLIRYHGKAGKMVSEFSGSNSILLLFNYFQLPWWFSSKESACQCRRLGFDPCVGKIPWRREWLPTLVFLPGNHMDRGTWQAIVHEVAKELDTT